ECRCGCGDWHRRAAVAHYLDEDRKFTPGDRVTVPDFVRPPNWPDWWTVDSWACGELRDADGPVYGVRPGNGVLGNDPTLLFAESELRSWVEPPKKTEAAGVLNGAQEVQS
ncbi:MAG: hypothetical protein ACRDTS_14820, partial [Mycobacterium sp.]